MITTPKILRYRAILKGFILTVEYQRKKFYKLVINLKEFKIENPSDGEGNEFFKSNPKNLKELSI